MSTDDVLTLKKSLDDPESIVPYLMSVCLARSSADSMGDCIRSAVKNAARLAVYDEMRISVKNHHTLPTIRPDIDLPHTYRNEYILRISLCSVAARRRHRVSHLSVVLPVCQQQN